MDVITMAKTNSLINRLSQAYPQFSFEESSSYSWSPSKNTIFYVKNGNDEETLVHELAHGLLGHTNYDYDIELIPMERAAWDKAKDLAEQFGVKISDEIIEDNLDSYRDWMHARSTCPACEATGLQVKKQMYKCPACTKTWRVNDARICGLKRYSVVTK